jgi:hypothetical protein
MRFDVFQRKARKAFASIPEHYREGIDGLTVSAEALPHPTLPDIYTLGHCLTESYPSDWTGPETTRSVVVLYHGSFRELAQLDPDFDWEEELWETLTHELRHHLESLASQDELGGVDYAMDEGFKRAEGLDFDPWYYQHGDRIAEGVFQVENHFFIEQPWTPEAFEGATELAFGWHGGEWRIPRPATLGDVHYVWVDGVDVGGGHLQLVLVRRRSWRQSLRGLLRREEASTLELWESDATATPVE